MVKFAGRDVRGLEDLDADVKEHAVGDRVKVEVLRAGKTVELTVRLGALH